MHLILSHAASHRWHDNALTALELPHLRQLLGRMRRVQRVVDTEDERPHPLLPHERVLAQALGWPESGPWPWAAGDSGSSAAQAWLTPCHWQVGMDQVVMLPPQALQLSDDESRQLLQAIEPWLAQDGLQLQWHSPLRWLASGDMLDGIAAASLARVSGMNIRPWITDGHLPPALRRLQSEMQMLLYQHPVNDARLARGLPIVNSFWLHGAGRLHAARDVAAPIHIDALDEGVGCGDQAAWHEAWQRIEREWLAPAVQASEPITLTLCSETAAHTWRTAPLPWTERLRRRWQAISPSDVLRALLLETPSA